jgi:hypothetical protein
MRFLMTFSIPHETFNRLIRDGAAGQTLGRLIEETKPEHIYLTEQDGRRAGVAVYNIPEGETICSVAEPWYLALSAECRFSVAMTPTELAKAGLDELGRKWAH